MRSTLKPRDPIRLGYHMGCAADLSTRLGVQLIVHRSTAETQTTILSPPVESNHPKPVILAESPAVRDGQGPLIWTDSSGRVHIDVRRKRA